MMNLFKYSSALAAWALAGAFHLPVAAQAQAPAATGSPVVLVVPFTPGSGGDIIARLIAPKLGEKWKRAVVVDNRVGASGIIGAEFVAKAPADGNTLLLAINTLTMTPSLYKKVPFDIFKDFKPVTKLAVSSFGLLVNSAVPVQDVSSLLAYARANPGKLDYASPGNGTPHHLAIELLKNGGKVFITHVPYKGLGGAMTDVLAGHVQVMFSAVPSLLPHVNGNKMRLLAVTGKNRSPLVPSVPTFREQGVTYMEGVDAWFAVFAPAKTPKDTVNTLQRDIAAVINLPEIRKQLESQGIMVETGTHEELEALTKADYNRWKKSSATRRFRLIDPGPPHVRHQFPFARH
ncbi:tripartite tricarboxylate transporter substrate binding protein [Polaromonas sp. P1-6]|nr:tripartite tricarboxylate transporter substrate binding protein [Polaromonas sp. P1-6]